GRGRGERQRAGRRIDRHRRPPVSTGLHRAEVLNSMIEAWWRSLKHQFLFLPPLDSPATIRRLMAFYVHEHNHVLSHSSFRGQTPDEMYFYEAACQVTPTYRSRIFFFSTHVYSSRTVQ